MLKNIFKKYVKANFHLSKIEFILKFISIFGDVNMFYILFFLSTLSFSLLINAETIDYGRFQTAQNHLFKNFDYEQEGQWRGPFFFVQMADCQLGFFDRNADWEKEIVLLEKAVQQINKLDPRFVIVCGDLVHAWPHNPEVRAKQIHDFKRIMSDIHPHIPLVCVCGNHDVENIPNRNSIKMYESDFGSHYLTFWVGGTQCFAINSSLIWNSSDASDIFEEQELWLKGQIFSAHKPTHRFLFMHHPWFIKNIEETDDYDVIPKARRIPYLDLLADSGFTATFSGHLHYNVINHYRGIELITTSAAGKPLGNDPSGFRVIKVFENHIEHEYQNITD